MQRTDNLNGDASRAEVSAVEGPGAALAPGSSETVPARAPSDAADVPPPENVGKSSDSGELIPASVWTTELPFLGVLALAVLGVLGLVAAWLNDDARPWLAGHIPWVVVGYGPLFAVMILMILGWWSKSRGTAVRAAVLILIGFPAILIALGGVLLVLPRVWQLNTLRTLVNVILFLTPAVMWWLFLASQRASLLNEFLANLQRLGLLEARRSLGETEEARATRIDSYLQKFEGTYGRVPQSVHDDVIGQNLQPYSREEAQAQAPVSIAAVPVTIAVVVLAIGWCLTLPPVDNMPAGDRSVWQHALTPDPSPVTFAFLGAYFFSIQMLFRRYVRSDLRGSAYVAVVMRIVLALIGIWVLQGIAEEVAWHPTKSHMLLLGFAVGVFPVVAWQIIRSIMSKIFRYALPSLESQLALNCLDGLTVWHEARLEEEDIENVPNMATADIVSLLISTRLPADRIVDWVDQAILLTYLGPDQASNSDLNSARHTLARHGVRTASALLSTARSMQVRGDFGAFAAVIEDESGRAVVHSLLSSIRTNSNLSLVLRWRGMEAAPINARQERGGGARSAAR